MIIDDVITCVARKQTPMILTRFKEHAKFLHDALKKKADHVFLLYGDNSDKENAEIRVKLKQIPRKMNRLFWWQLVRKNRRRV